MAKYDNNNNIMNYNYEEIVLINSHTSQESSTEECCIYNYDICKQQFDNLIRSLYDANACAKVTQYDIVETRWKGLHRIQHVQNGLAIETKTYEIVPFTCVPDANNQFVHVTFTKQKIPNVRFPSTMNFDDVRYIKRLVVRLNNRTFLNFQEEAPNKVHKVFININHSKDADNAKLLHDIERLKKKIADIVKESVQSRVSTS